MGAPGQEGSIHVAINAINLMVSDIDEGLSSIELTVNDISSTVSTHTGQMSVVQQSVNSISSTVSTHTGQISAFQQTVDEISSTVSAHTGQISTFQQTVDEIYLAVEDAVSGEYSSIIQRLNSIEVKVGNGEGTGSIQATSTEINLRVDAIDIGLTDVTITASGLLSSVSDLEDNLSTVNQTIDGWRSTVTKAGQITSQILQENGTVKISAEQIELEGSETADGNFVVNVDGTITAKGAEIRGSLSTRGYGSRRVDIDGGGMNIYNILGNRQIEFGVNEYGDAVLRYYDNNGVMLYDLGPKGLSMINVVEEAWIEVNNLLFLGSNYTTVLTTTAIKNKYKRPFSQSQVTYYRYQSQRIGNIIEDAVNDGKIFVSPSKSANKIPMGIYCIRQDAFRYNLFGEPYSTPIRQHSSNEVYDTGSLYQIYFQPLLDINQGILGYSTFDAFWSERNGVLPDEQ